MLSKTLNDIIIKDKNICIFNSCDLIKLSRGYCSKHYWRLKRHGDPKILKKTPNNTFKTCSIKGCNHKYRCLGFCKNHYELFRRYGKPEKKIRIFSFDFKIPTCIRKEVEERDKNQCRWYGCNITNDLHIHHIFPRSEYPQYKTITRFLITYCKDHHSYWHYKRNDKYWKLIKLTYSFRKVLSVIGTT